MAQINLLPEDTRHPITQDLERMQMAGNELNLILPRDPKTDLLSQTSEVVLGYLNAEHVEFSVVRSIMEMIRRINITKSPNVIVNEICAKLPHSLTSEEIAQLKEELLTIWGSAEA